MWSSIKAGGAMPVPQLTDPDTIEAYSSEPRLEESVVNTFGSVLHYWEAQRKQRPRLAKLALAYLSAPGKCRYTAVTVYYIYLHVDPCVLQLFC